MQIAELWDLFEGMSLGERNFAKNASQPLRTAGLSRGDALYSNAVLAEHDVGLHLDLIECLRYAIVQDPKVHKQVAEFDSIINGFFESHRVAFRLVDGEFVPFKSDELHRQVIEPVIRLLIDKRFERAQTAYISAIKEIAVDPADAITDAGTALQETFEALGCEGNAIGALLADARKKGLLGTYDKNLTDGIEKFGVWAAAMRNNKGDGHHVTDATRGDAWLMIHIVGALIVRLADNPAKGS